MRAVVRALSALFVVSLVAGMAQGAPITLSAVDSGWYDSSGIHGPSNQNYAVGSSDNYRNFFVFDLSGVSGTIVAADLALFSPAGQSSGTGTYTLYDVTTSIAVLLAGGSGQVATYNDLGSGTVYGSQFLDSTLLQGVVATVTLNGSAIAALNGASGQFALGGSLGASVGHFFYGTPDSPDVRELRLEVVDDEVVIPEPSTVLLCACGLAGLALIRRRRA